MVKRTKIIVAFYRPELEASRLFEDWQGPAIEVTYCYSYEEFIQQVIDAHVLVIPGNHYSSKVRDIIADSTVTWIQSTGVGINSYNDYGLSENVILTNARGVYTPTIVEHVLAMILGFARKILIMERSRIRREWCHNQLLEQMQTVHDRQLVVFGHGEIGSAISCAAAKLGMKVTGITRTERSARTSNDIPVIHVNSDEARKKLAAADFLVLTVPLTDETRRIVDRSFIDLLPSSCVIVNVSRGSIVDQEELILALRENRLSGACLDVFENEPLPPDNPLWDMENVILSPHVAGLGEQRELERLKSLLQDNLHHFINNKPLVNTVDLHQGY